jgi:hypothetical protein
MDKETKLKLALLRQKVEKLTGKKVKFIKESKSDGCGCGCGCNGKKK